METIVRFKGLRWAIMSNFSKLNIVTGHMPYEYDLQVIIVITLHFFVIQLKDQFSLLFLSNRCHYTMYTNYNQRRINKNYSLEKYSCNRFRKYKLFSSWLIDNMQTRYLAG